MFRTLLGGFVLPGRRLPSRQSLNLNLRRVQPWWPWLRYVDNPLLLIAWAQTQSAAARRPS